jgi:hypothetical protein
LKISEDDKGPGDSFSPDIAVNVFQGGRKRRPDSWIIEFRELELYILKC